MEKKKVVGQWAMKYRLRTRQEKTGKAWNLETIATKAILSKWEQNESRRVCMITLIPSVFSFF